MDQSDHWESKLLKGVNHEFKDFIPFWNTVWFLIGVSFMGRAVEPLIGYRAIGFLLLLAVLIVGFVGRLGPVLFAALVSGLIWNFFFIPPRFTFAISAPEDVLMCVTYFIAAIATGLLTNRVKTQELVIRQREERTSLLYEVMLDLTVGQKRNEFLLKITERLGEVLLGDCGIRLKSKSGEVAAPDLSYSFPTSGIEWQAAEFSFSSGRLAGWSTDQFDQAKALYVPLKGNNETVGVFRYEPSEKISSLTLDQENLLQSICRQVGLSLEQRYIEDRLRDADRLRDSEKMHQTLLNSISHELRTPLTAIVASVSAFENEDSVFEPAQRAALVLNLKQSSERLNRVVENLLDMSRLNAGGVAIKKEWHDVVDLVGVTIAKFKENFATPIKVEVASELPLVEIDFRLIEHVLFNLLVNAVTYSPQNSEVKLTVKHSEGFVRIAVSDAGPGIADEYKQRIFEKFFRIPGSPPGGTGLGLSIAKSIVEFHEGAIRVESSSGMGSEFIISLPLTLSPGVGRELR